MSCTQTLVGNNSIVRQGIQAQTARRQARRPFTILATSERKQAAGKLDAGAVGKLISAGAAAAMLLVRRPRDSIDIYCVYKQYPETANAPLAGPAFLCQHKRSQRPGRELWAR